LPFGIQERGINRGEGPIAGSRPSEALDVTHGDPAMTQDQTPDVPNYPAAPPTQPGMVGLPQRPSAWPKVIGIIAIVFGAGGSLGGIWGAVSPLFTDAFMSMVPGEQAAGMKEMMQQYKPYTIIGSLLSLGVAVLLLAAGIGLVQRRGWAPKISMLWSIVKIVFVIVNSIFGYMMAQASAAAMAQDPAMAQMPAGFMSVASGVGVALGACWGWALPVFMLVWFTRGKIKAEVAEWA